MQNPHTEFEIRTTPLPLKVRLLFWLLLSVMSVFFAEVVCGSAITGVFSVWGVLVLLPLYGIHVLLLAALAWRNGTPTLTTLWSAGAILGLYEAYITKMLWHHTWGPLQWPVAGVSLYAFVTLVI